MKNKIGWGIIFIFSVIVLVISLKLCWNIGVYADEYNITPTIVCGSEFWLYMEWVRLALIAAMTVISGVKLFSK